MILKVFLHQLDLKEIPLEHLLSSAKLIVHDLAYAAEGALD